MQNNRQKRFVTTLSSLRDSDRDLLNTPRCAEQLPVDLSKSCPASFSVPSWFLVQVRPQGESWGLQPCPTPLFLFSLCVLRAALALVWILASPLLPPQHPQPSCCSQCDL